MQEVHKDWKILDPLPALSRPTTLASRKNMFDFAPSKRVSGGAVDSTRATTRSRSLFEYAKVTHDCSSVICRKSLFNKGMQEDELVIAQSFLLKRGNVLLLRKDLSEKLSWVRFEKLRLYGKRVLQELLDLIIHYDFQKQGVDNYFELRYLITRTLVERLDLNTLQCQQLSTVLLLIIDVPRVDITMLIIQNYPFLRTGQ